MSACVPTFGIRTGFPVNAATEQEKGQFRLLFGPDSTSDVSHVIEAVEYGFLIQAFNLQADDVLVVEMVAGLDAGGYQERMKINGQEVRITADNNVVFLPWPFRYQVRKIQGSSPVGSFTVYAVPVPFEYMGAVAGSM